MQERYDGPTLTVRVEDVERHGAETALALARFREMAAEVDGHPFAVSLSRLAEEIGCSPLVTDEAVRWITHRKLKEFSVAYHGESYTVTPA